jgi:formylglycine-generating enzyme required for sulfatase activity
MGKYAVTQTQWKAVAALGKVECDLNPDPANFKGAQRPVEQVSWEEAVEFCKRLSQRSQKTYMLPSEAQWEYACRAGTTTPFHFGQTLTTDLANYRGTDWEEYNWSGSYGNGPKGVFREKTTNVGSFKPNAFGLYDMHGNVWEWCLDCWNDSYEGAPTDGNMWESNNERKVLRGGSWSNVPTHCRAASRGDHARDNRNDLIGFRICCIVPRT